MRSFRLLLSLLWVAAAVWPQAVSTSQVSGVVQDATGNLYLHWSPTEWRAIGAQSYGIKWADIHDPILVRDGIEDGAS